MEDQNIKKRVRDESDNSEIDSSDVKRLRDDLLSFLDDSDPDPTTHGLDSVMKSFEEEISPDSSSPLALVDLISDSGESRPELGFLLEASDDELGLPPSIASTSHEEKEEGTELIRVSSDSSGIGEFWGLEEQIPSYDSFEYEVGENYSQTNSNNNTEYVAFDGLFDHSDVLYYDSSEYSDFSYRPESMPTE